MNEMNEQVKKTGVDENGFRTYDAKDLYEAYEQGRAERKEEFMSRATSVEVVGEMRDLRIDDAKQRFLFKAKKGDRLRIIILEDYD